MSSHLQKNYNLSVADKGRHFGHIVKKFLCPSDRFVDNAVSGDMEIFADDGKCYQVHSSIILPLSPFLREITELLLDKHSVVKIVLDQVSSRTLKTVIELLYTGETTSRRGVDAIQMISCMKQLGLADLMVNLEIASPSPSPAPTTGSEKVYIEVSQQRRKASLAKDHIRLASRRDSQPSVAKTTMKNKGALSDDNVETRELSSPPLPPSETNCPRNNNVPKQRSIQPKMLNNNGNVDKSTILNVNYELGKPSLFPPPSPSPSFIGNIRNIDQSTTNVVEGVPKAREAKTLYHCQHCSYECKYWSRMINHSMTHQGSTFSCSYCSYNTPRLSALKTHQYFQHVGRGRITCGVCGFKALNSNLMQKHIDKWHAAAGHDEESESLVRSPSSESQSRTSKSKGKKDKSNTKPKNAIDSFKIPTHLSFENESDLAFCSPRKEISEKSKASKTTKSVTEERIEITNNSPRVFESSTRKLRARKVINNFDGEFNSFVSRRYSLRSSTSTSSRTKKLVEKLLDDEIDEDEDGYLSTMTC